MKKRNYMILLFVILFCASSAYGSTYYVDPKGSDATGIGSSLKPWRSINYALKMVKSGDTISINDGIYSENQMVVPSGVSITSTSQNNTKVKVWPNIPLYSKPFLVISSPSPGSTGNQSVSYIELDGVNGSNKADKAILVQNRNNVRIHHCTIRNFMGNPRTVEIKSTQIPRTVYWWSFWPEDVQAPGNNKNIDSGVAGFPTHDNDPIKYAWPSNPVENFEFDNNTVTDSTAIDPYNLKNSSFHHNIIDNRNTYGWCFGGVLSFLDNVDIHDNTLYAQKQAPPKTAWNVELWGQKNGCEYYNNKMNGWLSFTYGKETKIYGNTLIMAPEDFSGTGIEFNGQSYGEIYNNYIGGANFGIRVGSDATGNKKDFIVQNVTVRDNKIYNPKSVGIWVQGAGPNQDSHVHTIVRNISVYNNAIDGQTSAERGDAEYRGYMGIKVSQDGNEGSSELSNIYVKNNIVIDITGYAGVTTGKVSNMVINGNQFYGNRYNSWSGSIATNTITTAPAFESLKYPTNLLAPPTLRIIQY